MPVFTFAPGKYVNSVPWVRIPPRPFEVVRESETAVLRIAMVSVVVCGFASRRLLRASQN
jgi:hypothetical protein